MNRNALAFAIGFALAYVGGRVALSAYSAETDRMYPVSPAAVKLIAMSMPDPEPVNPWTPITFSVYATKYIGRPMKHGGRYDHKALTCATNRFPKGTVLECEWNGRSVRVVVRDTMASWSNRTRVDLSGAAFRALFPKYDMTNRTATLLEGARFRVVRP